MLIAIIFLIILFYIAFLYYFLIKNDNFCDNLKSLYLLNSNNQIKYSYLKLKFSNLTKPLSKLFRSKHKTLFCEKLIYDEKKYLLTLAKFIDFKINNQKLTFRAKNKIILIDNLSLILAKSIHHNQPIKIFKQYKTCYSKFELRRKENKIFKILLAQKLIIELINIENELKRISKIINRKHHFIFNYRKSIFNDALFYSLLKFHNNANYFKYKYQITNKHINRFLSELFDADYKIKVIIFYLKAMF